MYHWENTIGDIDAAHAALEHLGLHTSRSRLPRIPALCERPRCGTLFCITMAVASRQCAAGSDGPLVQDALDAIEYANGRTNSFWVRCAPRPAIRHHFISVTWKIGNENGGGIITSAGPCWSTPSGQNIPHPSSSLIPTCCGRPYPRTQPASWTALHESPESFMWRASQYDSYDRNGLEKISFGEYAVTQERRQGQSSRRRRARRRS